MHPRNRNILVTGGAGYVGSHACKALASAGYTPVVIDNLTAGHRWAVKWGPLIEGDIADRALLTRTIAQHKIAAVLHFAAHAYVGESVEQPRKYFDNNVTKTLSMLDALLDTGVRHFVFSSSCATYGEPQKLPLTEDHPQNPVNPYGETKLAVEKILKWYAPVYGLRYVNLRYFNAAGADSDGEIGEHHDPETHLIPLVVAAAQGTLAAIQIFGTDYDTKDGTAVRDYVHVTDLAQAHVKALAYLLNDGDSVSLNLGTGHGHSIREVIAAVAAVSGKSVPTVEAQRRPGDPPLLIAATARSRAVLGWQPVKSDLDTIIRTAWNWHQSRALHGWR